MVQPKLCLLMTKIRSSESAKPSASPRSSAIRPEEGGFDQDHAADLAGGGAQVAEQAEFAAAVEDQGEERIGGAQHGYDDGDGFERPGDGEGAVEDLDGCAAQGLVGRDGDAEGRGAELQCRAARSRGQRRERDRWRRWWRAGRGGI